MLYTIVQELRAMQKGGSMSKAREREYGNRILYNSCELTVGRLKDTSSWERPPSKWSPDVNLLKEDVGNVPVWVKLHDVPVTAFSEDGLSAITVKLGTPLMLDSYTFDMCLQSWGRSSYARAMIELRADMDLKDTIMVDMPKIMGEGYYTYRFPVGEYNKLSSEKIDPLEIVEKINSNAYRLKLPSHIRCSNVFNVKHLLPYHGDSSDDDLVVNSRANFVYPEGMMQAQVLKNGPFLGFKPHKEYRPIPKKPTASPSGNKKKGVTHTNEVSNSNPFDGLNSVDNDVELVGFKPHKEYRPIPKKPTASPSGNKKKGVAHTNEVSNSNPFYGLNSVDNDVELSTNEGTTNLVNNGANSSGSSFMNVKNSSTINTPIIDKIGRFEDLLIDGQVILVDEAGYPLKKVECPGDYDSKDEVASVDNDMARSLASERVGFSTQSLLEQ
ncbi:retrotransposon protein, putative, ty1-copia subclass [Tanacetum coccineum]